MTTQPVGRRGLLIEAVDDAEDPLWPVILAEILRDRVGPIARQWGSSVDVVAGAGSVLIEAGRDIDVPASGLRSAIDALLVEAVQAAQTGERRTAVTRQPVLDLPVHYDGPDLATVARIWGVPPSEVAARHSEQVHVVAFCGFAPGFAYLRGDGRWPGLPRLATPRTRVPAGSVGLAGPFTGIYPNASPGGWQLIGRTEVALWDLERDPPALLAPGTRVRFRAVGDP